MKIFALHSFLILLGTLLLGANSAFCQKDTSSSSRPIGYWVILDSIYDCSKIAKQDIQKGNANLYIIGGVAPIIYENQNEFEKRFGIRYFDSGCDSTFEECMMQYNLTIFAELDRKFGKSWRKEVRKDVLGFNKWKKKRKHSSKL
ncbi:MAG: hypothetical protein IT258_10805 [Saprospiraceae bacterium]|nr:hypothetical protein [Saprospiraceae bacterium]